VKVIIIVNPASAGGRLGREWPRLERKLRDAGLEAHTVFTERPWHAAELAERAVADGEELVAAAGGDGTVFETAMGLHRAGGGTLAILPLGTGNDAARTLGVPLRLEDAARVAMDGGIREVDLIRVGEYLVPNAIGLGLTADISERAARIKWIRGLVVYLVTAGVSMFRFPTPKVRITTPDGVFYDGDMTIIAIHNGPTSGGGFNLTPHAVPDDGLLDVTLVPGIGPLGRVPRLVAAMRGTLGEMKGTLEAQVPWLELEFEDTLSMHVDGNQAKLEPPKARFEVLPRALKVRVPTDSIDANGAV
jgi:YegS/Rv2252/BmrU family lipid kinase